MITTQTIKNWLGGISSQPDDKKFKGQVVDALNVYPDPTFGLRKRMGTRFVGNLGHNEIEHGKWFFIHRDGTERYIGVVYETEDPDRDDDDPDHGIGQMRIWNALTAEECKLTYTDKYAKNYLNVHTMSHWDRYRDHFHFMTVQDVTYVTNSSRVVRRYKGIEGEGGVEGDEWYIDILSAEFDQPYQICIKQGNETKCICMIFTKPEIPEPELTPLPELPEPTPEPEPEPEEGGEEGGEDGGDDPIFYGDECKQGEGADQNGDHCIPETCDTFKWDCYPKDIKLCVGGCYDAYASTHGCNGKCPAEDLEYMWQVKSNGQWKDLENSWSRNVRHTFHAEDLEVGDTIQGRILARCNDFPGGKRELTGDEFTITVKKCGGDPTPEPEPEPEPDKCPDCCEEWDEAQQKCVPKCGEGQECIGCECITCELEEPDCKANCDFERPECFEGDYLKDGCVTIETEVLNNQIIIDNLLCYLEMINDDENIDLCYEVEKTSFGLKIVSCDGSGSLEITAEGGIDGGALFAFTDVVGNVSLLPSRAYNGQKVRVKNSVSTADDLCVVFETNNGESYGDGFWQETRCDGASIGFNIFDMPHGLWNIGPNRFKFGPIDWCKREVGDEETNKDPSFVCKTINSTFFFENRLGILSENFVCMSRFDEYHCFYKESIRLALDSDPIDITANTTRPTNLRYSIPEQQGMSIFSNSQQHLLYSTEAGLLAPRTVQIRTVSEYEMETNIEPHDAGDYNVFINKGKPWAYTRVMGMQQRGADASPTVVELSKVCDERIPLNIDEIESNEQNNLNLFYSQSSPEVWVYRTFNDGQKDVMNTWVRWCLPGDVQFMAISNDMLMIVTNQACRTTLHLMQLVSTFNFDRALPGNPFIGTQTQIHVDMGFEPTGDPITEDGDKWYQAPFNVACCDDGTEGRLKTQPLCIALPNDECKLENADVYRGYVGRKDGKDYVCFDELDPDDYKYLYMGLSYDMKVDLPTLFTEVDEKMDYTAVFTVQRYMFSMGTTNYCEFHHQAYGRTEWKQIVPVVYQAPYVWNQDGGHASRYIFNCPIHQRNEHFRFRVFSNSAWPVNMTSMMWEARYNPRWHKRS